MSQYGQMSFPEWAEAQAAHVAWRERREAGAWALGDEPETEEEEEEDNALD